MPTTVLFFLLSACFRGLVKCTPIPEVPTAILPKDTAGLAKFSAMSANIPDIAPRGTLTGDMTNVDYSDSDPDCWWTYSQCVTPKLSGLKPDVSSVPEPHTLGYGFDDGPYCGHNVFYNYLATKKQKATFFYIGSNVQGYPLEAQRAVTDGHEICVHTWSHPYMTATTNEGAFAELWYTLQMIKLATGVTPTCWRPPYGDVDDRIRYIAAQLGLETILWLYDTDDAEEGSNGVTAKTVQANYDSFIAKARSGAFNTTGAIILTHELDNFTTQAAIDNYPTLAGVFDHIVPIAVSQNKTQPYVETNYTMPSFAEYISNTTLPNNSSLSSASSLAHSSSSSSPSSSSTQVAPTGGASALGVSVPAAALALGAVFWL
ncbi:hypothetical protein B0H17DRAFT_1172887 [Mycena rosella]|uniref:chitin deacetylase n=1 Tax=Mycena rosella TaxID=1033263 RepID=A0AAD7BGP8_MYCRO|nr:hypothetical protein B0H17DRAFT_1172887 [Mycena rosella]